ncbi:type II toxin-antitoxin system RelE/ParE family toxin [Mucilaginibacter sp.]|jgi:plasmid stabilization system protein ParE|uniref:type II toxin-antitoxin system RelE/ParE family toxin n=1 Tax=Mucilaginibacter sp. TaxID=1882438 RepID=UPI0039C96E11
MIAINWTPEAERTFSQNLEYLAYRWNNKVVIEFINKVDESLLIIASNPKAFPLHSSTLHIHKYVIVPQITVYYRIVNDHIIDLLTFWNNYQNPDKLHLG